MRSIRLLPVLLLLLFASCSKERRFTIVGTFQNMPVQMVRLEELHVSDTITVIDSSRTDAEGKFELSGETAEPGLYRLSFAQGGKILLSLDKGTVRLAGDYRALPLYTVQGSPSSQSLQGFLRMVSGYARNISTLDQVMSRLHTEGRDSSIAGARAEPGAVGKRAYPLNRALCRHDYLAAQCALRGAHAEPCGGADLY